MRLVLMATLLVLLLVAPAAEAGWFSREPPTVTVASSYVGDVLRFDPFWPPGVTPFDPDTEPCCGSVVVRIEGFAQAEDAYAIERETTVQLVEHVEDDRSWRAFRCHALRGGADEVRTEVLRGGEARGWGYSGGDEEFERMSLQTLAHGGACPWVNVAAGRTFSEGQQVRLSELAPHEAAERGEDVLSAPAVATRFLDRPALEFVFDVITANPMWYRESLHVTVADGLPGIVRIHGDWGPALQLAGYAPGAGPLVPVDPAARLPDAHPGARTVAYAPLAFDDAAWGLAYPFEEALALLRGDASLEIGRWLDAHPDAYLVGATYHRELLEDEFPGMSVDGEWSLTFYDDVAGHRFAATARARPPVDPALLPVESPTPLVRNRDEGGGDPIEFMRAPHGETLAASAAFVELARRAGILPEDVQELTFYIEQSGIGHKATLLASDVSDRSRDGSYDGLEIEFSPFTGGYRSVFEVRQDGYEPAPIAFGGRSPPALGGEGSMGAFGALIGPVPTLAGGAALTVAALLLLALKFGLVPFYSRLVRARLLENPIRARLFERVRAEPGIRQQELVDFTGAGPGATRHHLEALVKHGFLVRLETGAFVSYYAAGEVPPALARQASLLRSGSARRVYELYASEPDITLREAGERLGMSAPNVHRVKKKLHDAGLLPAAPMADGLVAEA